MFRISLATVLIGVGVFSPWLVRDWLDWSADEDAANQLYSAVADLPGAVSEAVTETVVETVAGTVKENARENREESTLSSKRSYPVASATMRVLKGFLPDSFATTSGKKLPFMGMSSSPSASSVSREVISKTGAGLQGRLNRLGLKLGDPVFVRIFKEENELELWMKKADESQFTLFKVYRIVDRAGSLGPKQREGDNQAPEGFYHIGASRMIPDTKHFLGMDFGYPNEYDAFHNRSGSEMMIHGGARSAGSYALSRDSMSEVYTLSDAALRNGQRFFRVNAFPFRMTDKRMELEWKRQPRWIGFWKNLKEGYDFFENVNYPPEVAVSDGDYFFSLH